MRVPTYSGQLRALLLATICAVTLLAVDHARGEDPAGSRIATRQPDLGREKRLADEAIAGMFTGEALWLNTAQGKFLALDTVPEGSARGAVVILHGRGFHPDWPEVANPLRTGLAEQGWRTLSLQMPVLEKDATYYDYVPIFPAAYPRIEAAIQYLRDKGVKRIILAAHSCGVHMAMAWIRARGDSTIDGFIGIGMGATEPGQPMRAPFPLAAMHVPVFDVYGSLEYPDVMQGAPARLQAMRQAGNPKSTQIVIAGSDHYFRSGSDKLVAAVASWLSDL